jgi:hypothetical protein
VSDLSLNFDHVYSIKPGYECRALDGSECLHNAVKAICPACEGGENLGQCRDYILTFHQAWLRMPGFFILNAIPTL